MIMRILSSTTLPSVEEKVNGGNQKAGFRDTPKGRYTDSIPWVFLRYSLCHVRVLHLKKCQVGIYSIAAAENGVTLYQANASLPCEAAIQLQS
jgi:hypothetical protein